MRTFLLLASLLSLCGTRKLLVQTKGEQKPVPERDYEHKIETPIVAAEGEAIPYKMKTPAFGLADNSGLRIRKDHGYRRGPVHEQAEGEVAQDVDLSHFDEEYSNEGNQNDELIGDNKHEETSSSVETFHTLNSIESFKNDEFFGDNNKKSKESESIETFNTLSTQNPKEFVDEHSNEDNNQSDEWIDDHKPEETGTKGKKNWTRVKKMLKRMKELNDKMRNKSNNKSIAKWDVGFLPPKTLRPPFFRGGLGRK